MDINESSKVIKKNEKNSKISELKQKSKKKRSRSQLLFWNALFGVWN